MSRPPKKRFVMHRPRYVKFGPICRELEDDCDSGVCEITLDQLEAMRLADLEGYSQEDAAYIMKVSRQTFGRIVEVGRKQTASALINGKVLMVSCEEYIEFYDRYLKCIECAHEWVDSSDPFGDSISCPGCGSGEIIKMKRCGKGCQCPLKVAESFK